MGFVSEIISESLFFNKQTFSFHMLSGHSLVMYIINVLNFVWRKSNHKVGVEEAMSLKTGPVNLSVHHLLVVISCKQIQPVLHML